MTMFVSFLNVFFLLNYNKHNIFVIFQNLFSNSNLKFKFFNGI